MISLDACNVCQTYPATASLHPAVQMTLAGSAHGGTWGLSLPRLLSAGDSLSLCAAQIPTLSVHRFAIHLSGTFFIPNIVYAVRPDLSRIFLMTAFCIRRSLRIQPGNLPLPHCSHKWLSAHRSPATRFPALFL